MNKNVMPPNALQGLTMMITVLLIISMLAWLATKSAMFAKILQTFASAEHSF